MKREILIQNNYLLLPIAVGEACKTISFYVEGEKIYEFKIPILVGDNYSYQYKAAVPVSLYLETFISMEGDYSEAFVNEISQTDILPTNEEQHPRLHFSPNTGWINDPNGLIYNNGLYHLYFQYNPFDTQWENMCWGHAVSHDLLHWDQKETVLYPDKDGLIFSGCGMTNENALLGLPKDSYLYFYTCAGGISDWSKGKLTTQELAYSTDGGYTLNKLNKSIIEHISDQNRDPKVFWHELTKAYVMVLYLTENEFAILRSTDLENWEISQRLILEKSWECPDLLEVPIVGGNTKWMFWSADGFYFLGDFDGYTFRTDEIRREAYKTTLPYAAQTYWGTMDRIVTIPWIRSLNKNKLYRGVMGLPRELVLVQMNQGLVLSQLPIREFNQQKVLKYNDNLMNDEVVYQSEEKAVVEIQTYFNHISKIEWTIFGSPINYDASTGMINVAGKDTMVGTRIEDISIISDCEIIEITANQGTIYAVYELGTDNQSGAISIKIEGSGKIEIYQLK